MSRRSFPNAEITTNPTNRIAAATNEHWSVLLGKAHLAARGETVLVGRLSTEKRREITAGILYATTNFPNRIGRKSVENSFDMLSIDLSMNAREVTEAHSHHAANP
jgi:hypothetical protein